jgi:hypothetical protein
MYVLVGSTLIAGSARSAWAQGYALRSGANVNPDQVSVGGQYELGPVNERFWLQPNADLGFGNDATLLALNFDVVYRKALDSRSFWTGYAGGGPAINWYKLLGYSQTEPGANLVGGLMHARGLFTEVRIGFLDSPQLRFGVGYAFGRNSGVARRPPAPRRR